MGMSMVNARQKDVRGGWNDRPQALRCTALTRQKFEPLRLELRGPDQVERAIAVLKNAPLDDLKPLECLIQEPSRKRGLDANGYYWLRLGEIAKAAWLDGRQYNSDCWHEYAKRNIMPDVVVTKDGEVRSKWVELPDGTLAVISTTELEKGFFAKYTTMCEAFGANLGVEYSADPRQQKHY